MLLELQEWDLARRRQDERLEALREELESVSEVAGRISNTINQQKVVMECLEERVRAAAPPAPSVSGI